MAEAVFIKQAYGAVVATILEADDAIVEVQQRNDGVYGLIIHRRRFDSDAWDDLTAYLKPEHFEALGSVAKLMTGLNTAASDTREVPQYLKDAALGAQVAPDEIG